MTKLLLIPTQPELAVLQPLLDKAPQYRDWSVELCGFGPIAAAARTSLLIARDQPERILLIGIAGAYTSHLALGTSAVFNEVACYGVGAGTGDHHQSADDLGWPQWQEADSSRTIGDLISLEPVDATGPPGGNHLLTCCAASATAEDVRCRTHRYPSATAEDMEGFGVAMACELAGVPLRIARGISNVAGDRNKEHWQTMAALQSVAGLALTIMAQESTW